MAEVNLSLKNPRLNQVGDFCHQMTLWRKFITLLKLTSGMISVNHYFLYLNDYPSSCPRMKSYDREDLEEDMRP